MEGNQSAPVQRERILRLFRTCSHLLYHHGPNRGQARILQLMQKHGSIAQRELQDHAGIRSASLSELLCKMEASGSIEREKCEADRRSVRIRLTEEGHRQALILLEEQQLEDERLLSPLSDGELDQLDAILEKLATRWMADLEEDAQEHVKKQEH